MELYSSLVLPLREGEIPNDTSSLETFSIRVTIESIIVLFVLLVSLSVYLLNSLVLRFVPSPWGHSWWSYGPQGLTKPYSVVFKGFGKTCSCALGRRGWW